VKSQTRNLSTNLPRRFRVQAPSASLPPSELSALNRAAYWNCQPSTAPRQSRGNSRVGLAGSNSWVFFGGFLMSQFRVASDPGSME
jgi:hypothetical protein